MPTTLGTLLDSVVAETTDSTAVDTAIVSIGELGRALLIIGQGRSRHATTRTLRQQLMLERLGTGCRGLARLWPPQDGTLVDVTAAAADLVGTRADRLEEGERWVLGVALATTAGQLLEIVTRASRYKHVDAVERVGRDLSALARLARLDPPRAPSRAILDEPMIELDREAPSSFPAAAAGLLCALERDSRTRALGVNAVLAVCHAAQAAAEAGVAIAERVEVEPWSRGVGWRRTPEAWQVLEAALVRFEDGSRRRHDDDLPTHRWAQRLQKSAADLADQPQHLAQAYEATLARGAANQLPHMARHIENAIERWAGEGCLIARARNLPRSERHVDAVIGDRFVVANPADVAPALLAAQVTRRLSATLACELHRNSGRVGIQPQPHLAAALADEAAGGHTARDAAYAERLADRYRQIQQRRAV